MTHPCRKEHLVDLQFLTRQYEFITDLYVQAKLNIRTLVDQVFPSYEGVFKDLYSKRRLTSLRCVLDRMVVKAGMMKVGLKR
ncbi:hypothetical protein D3C78_1431150 [compost metagenome]